jgi:hypothetical protein
MPYYCKRSNVNAILFAEKQDQDVFLEDGSLCRAGDYIVTLATGQEKAYPREAFEAAYIQAAGQED